MKLSEKKKIALVLSGGGVKAAAFHIGVCLALKEKGFRFAGGTPEEVQAKHSNKPLVIKLYVGSSAGSVVSTFLASGYSLDSVIRAFERGSGELSESFASNYDEDAPYDLRPISYKDIFHINSSNLLKSIPNFLMNMSSSMIAGGLEAIVKNGISTNGIFTTKGLEKYIRKEVWPANRFDSLGVELFIVGTQLNRSRKVIFGTKNQESKDRSILYVDYASMSDAVAASTSLPPAFAPYPIKNHKGTDIYYFDGEIRDTLSTHIAADHGADLVISSYSIQPYKYNSEIGSLHKFGIPVILNQALYQVIEQKIEKHIQNRKAIASIYNAVDGYLRQTNTPDDQREKLLSIITERTNYRPETDFIYIHPNSLDHETFFADHFSLSPNTLQSIVQSGFKSTISTLRKFDI